jgi:hypothetical protein
MQCGDNKLGNAKKNNSIDFHRKFYDNNFVLLRNI